jgi:hypothetical protein
MALDFELLRIDLLTPKGLVSEDDIFLLLLL